MIQRAVIAVQLYNPATRIITSINHSFIQQSIISLITIINFSNSIYYNPLLRVLTTLENLENLENSGNFLILENSGKIQGILNILGEFL